MSVKAKKIMQENFDLTLAPNVFYKKFFARFPEIKSLDVSEWKSVHLIAYFCELYESLYGLKYTFKFNASPTRCYEVIQIKRMVAMLNTTDPKIIKDYITWIFANKMTGTKRQMKVIGYLATQELVDEFKRTARKSEEVNRSTPLPTKYISVLENHNFKSCQTYGSLAFLWLAAKSEDSDTYTNLFNDLLSEGLNISIFGTMK